MRITRPFVLLALAALLAPRAVASRTSVWERNPPAATVLAKTDAAGLLASLAPAATDDAGITEAPPFDLGDVVLVERELEREERFGLGPLDLLGPTPLRGPPSSYLETRVGGFELLPPFRVGASPSLSLWPHQACGFSCREVASDSRYDPWGLQQAPGGSGQGVLQFHPEVAAAMPEGCSMSSPQLCVARVDASMTVTPEPMGRKGAELWSGGINDLAYGLDIGEAGADFAGTVGAAMLLRKLPKSVNLVADWIDAGVARIGAGTARMGQVAGARHQAWASRLNSINETVVKLGERALRESGGDWRKSEELFKNYLGGVSNRLERAGSSLSVEWQPAAVPGEGRVPAFINYFRRGDSGPLIMNAKTGEPRLFAYPDSRRLDSGIVDLTTRKGPHDLPSVVSGFDITLDAAKPNAVPYYREAFGDIPIFDVRPPAR